MPDFKSALQTAYNLGRSYIESSEFNIEFPPRWENPGEALIAPEQRKLIIMAAGIQKWDDWSIIEKASISFVFGIGWNHAIDFLKVKLAKQVLGEII